MVIDTCWKFNLALSHGKYAWPGGYPLYFICADGEALSWDAAVENARLIRNAIISHDNYDGWNIIGLEVNWEDSMLRCMHTGANIESAYGEELV